METNTQRQVEISRSNTKDQLWSTLFTREQEQHQAKVVFSKLLQPAAARAAARPKQKLSPVPLSHPWRRFDFTENSIQARERRGELCILRK